MIPDMLEATENKYEELNHELSDIRVISDQARYRELMKEHSDIEPLVNKYREYKRCKKQIDEAREILAEKPDEELAQLADLDIKQGQDKLEELDRQIRVMLIPRDEDDDKNVIIEIRAGAGGEEAALFANVLYRMYIKYAESKGWKTSILDYNDTEIGGFREVVFLVEGSGANSKFKYESGVHRVQRIPATEAGGRIHTSTVTVAVLPEAQEVEIGIEPSDLRIDTYRASGAGGQHINKTDSAIRITHFPTGIVVSCQDERSQHKNKEKAMRVLRAKLYDLETEKQENRIADERKSQVGRGNRNERIRTYNYPQGRVTDHRIGLTLYKLDSILEGGIEPMIEALSITEQTEKLNRIGVQ
jgi:peptide chain release factor 1